MKRAAKILLVEDDQSMLDGMKDLLQVLDIGYDVTIYTASNGREGLAQVQQHSPNIIVSDIMMPIMDGIEFLNEVRKNPTWFAIPFIFLTAKGDQHEIHEGRLSGADLYITKPFDSTQLLDLIKTQLDRAFRLEVTHQQSMDNLKRGVLQILNHELRTPLTYVTAYYEMLAESVDRSVHTPDIQEYLRGIQAGCVRLTRLVDDFILVIELRTGEAKAFIEATSEAITDMDAVIRQAVETAQRLSQFDHVTVIFESDGELPVVYGNRARLQNVFERLLDNAIKFTHSHHRENGSVHIRAGVNAGNLVVDIEDQGYGLPESVHQRIFDLFYQHDRSLLEQQGAGIGLTITKGLVELHGGRIALRSEEKMGSTFSVWLPEYDGEKRPFPPTAASQNGHHRATVLVVEDDQHLLIGLKELLELVHHPYKLQVFTATDGEAGLELMHKHPVNLIISDIMMSPMNGLEFLDEVRKIPEWVQIPFIFLTARGEPQDIHEGWTKGVQMYITKPYDSEQLIEYVVTQLNRHFRGQQILAQGFEDLKRSILDLMTPDFRSPLTSVASYSDRLVKGLAVDGLADAQDDIQLKEALEGIKDGGLQLTSLVEDFIALAELRTGEALKSFKMRAQPISDSRWIFQEIFQHQQASALQAGIDLTITQPDIMPGLYGDSHLLAEATRRVLKCALKLCQEYQQPHLSVNLYPQNTNLHIDVKMPFAIKQEQLALYELLINKELDTSPNQSEDAPSLQIVYGYMRLHNGRIQLNNKANSFTISLILPIHPFESMHH